MAWISDQQQFITINLILEGFATIVSHTFPSAVHAGDTITGTVTIRNDGDAPDNFMIVISRLDTVETILDEIITGLAVAGTYTTGPASFVMPANSVDLVIETFHEE